MIKDSKNGEGFLAQWEFYGIDPKKLDELINEKRITSKNVFSDFLHWYLDGYLMFAEYINLKTDEYEYIRYRKFIDWLNTKELKEMKGE